MEQKKMNDFGRKGWAVIIYVLFVYMFSACVNDTINVAVEVFANKLGMNSNALLPITAVGGFLGILVSLIFGIIVAKKNVKWPTAIIFFLFALLWLLNGNINSFGMYAVVVAVITAVSNTINLVSTQQIISNWFPRKKGIALGWASMGMCFSSAIMVAVFEGMFGISIQAPYYLMAVISVIMGIITIVWFKSYPEEAGADPDNIPLSEEEKRKNLEFINSYKSEWTAGRLLKNKEFWMLVVIFGILFIGLLGVVSQMIPRLMSVGMEKNQSILWLTIASVIGIPASFFWGYIDQKIGTGKTLKIYCVLWTLMMVCGAVGTALINIPVSIISVIFYACLLGGLGNLMPSMIIQVYGRYDFAQANKIAMPIVVGFRSLALIIVPAVLASVEAAGNPSYMGFRNVFVVFIVLSLIATILSFIIKDKTIGKL